MSADTPKIQHQLYDMMYLHFDITAANNLDLDNELRQNENIKSILDQNDKSLFCIRSMEGVET